VWKCLLEVVKEDGIGQAGSRWKEAQVVPPLLLYLALVQQQKLQHLLQLNIEKKLTNQKVWKCLLEVVREDRVSQAGPRQEQAQVGPPLLLYLALVQQQESSTCSS
jgi:hypothetical protein